MGQNPQALMKGTWYCLLCSSKYFFLNYYDYDGGHYRYSYSTSTGYRCIQKKLVSRKHYAGMAHAAGIDSHSLHNTKGVFVLRHGCTSTRSTLRYPRYLYCTVVRFIAMRFFLCRDYLYQYSRRVSRKHIIPR